MALAIRTRKLKKRPSRRSIGAVRNPATEAAILGSAAQVLRADGYDGFTIEAVAKRARAGKPTIYKWWKSKMRLIGEVYLKHVPVRHTRTDVRTFEQDLTAQLELLWRVWSDPNWSMASRRLFSESMLDSEALAFYRDGYLVERNQPFTDIVERAIARGELPPATDVGLVVDVLSSFCLFRLAMERPVDRETISSFVNLLCHGLFGRRAKSAESDSSIRDEPRKVW